MKLGKIDDKIIKSKNDKIYMQKDENKIYVTDGIVVFIIKEKDFIFDINKFKHPDIKSIIYNDIELSLEDATVDKVYLDTDKKQYAILKGEEHEVTINNKCLSYFNTDCTFKIQEELKPVIVYENDEVVGVIMPIKRY